MILQELHNLSEQSDGFDALDQLEKLLKSKGLQLSRPSPQIIFIKTAFGDFQVSLPDEY